MAETKVIPEGYKRSPLGVIPEEWEVKRLGEICIEARLGGNYENAESNSGIPVVKMGNIGRGKIVLDKVQYLPLDEQYNHADVLKYDDLLFNTRNTLELVGKVAIWRDELPYAIYNSNLLRIYFDKQSVYSNEYMNTAFNSYLSIKQLRGYATGTTSVAAIYSRDLFKMKFTLPPLAEQERITEILGCWDKGIELQGQLVEKLELRKRALMQQLFTARTRLKGFSGNWENMELGRIGDTYNGLTGKVKEDFGTGNPFITYMNVFGSPKINPQMMDFVQLNGNNNQNRVKYGDIFFTVSSETPEEVGMSAVLLDDLDDTYLNSFCFGYRLFDFKTLLPEFAQYYFRSRKFRIEMYMLAQGSTRFNISKGEVLKLKIQLPSLSEQTAIAEILTNADREIDLARAKLATLRQQKKGLMQQLLTGKTRVKI